MGSEIKSIWDDVVHLDGLTLTTIVWIISPNKLNHSIAIAQSISSGCGVVLSENQVTFPLETFQAISQELLGTAIGVNTGDAIRYRSSKDQLYQKLREHKDVLVQIISEEEYTTQLLKTSEAVSLVRQLATLIYAELYDRNLVSKTEEEQ